MKGIQPKSQLNKSKVLHSSAILFLSNGYQNTTIAEIAKKAEISESAIFRVFSDKEKILCSLIEHVYDAQFVFSEDLLKNDFTDCMLYGIETALQFYIVEESENLRDLYLTAYTLPTTKNYIYKKTAQKLKILFSKRLPTFSESDFYELEIATGGMVRSFMSCPCDMYFSIEKKIQNYLNYSLKLFNVSDDEIQKTIKGVLAMDLKSKPKTIISSVVEKAEKGLLG